MNIRTQNQLHPPKKKSRKDVELNKKCTIIKKDGTNTSVVGYGTRNACAVFTKTQRENAEKLNIKLVGNYKILNHEVK